MSPAAPRTEGPRPADLAEYPTRALAAIVDALIVAALQLCVAGVVFVIVVLVGNTATHAGHVVRDNALFIGIPIGFLYAPLAMAREGARNGQTLGKQALGIRVVRARLAPMDVPVGLLREAVGKQLLTVVTVGLYALADYLWPLGDSQRQALHDKMAQTWVVRATVAPSAPEPEPDHLLAERGALKREG
ncbi:MAG: domain containing protein, partial [Solirubrobacterales bacterium]|nr:domain containing protein [Solirubrobacterales bacterium]